MPITRPSEATSGPPELPGLIAASVWIAPEIWKSVSEATERSTAETIPTDSDCACPKGEPQAAPGGGADGRDRPADRDLLAVAQRQRPQGKPLRIYVQQRDVGVRIVAE